MRTQHAAVRTGARASTVVGCALAGLALAPACSSTTEGTGGASGSSGSSGAPPCSHDEPGCTGQPPAPQCTRASDCAGMKDASCATPSCASGVCSFAFAPKGTPYPKQVAGDCQKVECDGAGNEETVPDDTDRPPATSDCVETPTCNGGAVVATPKPEKAACTSNGGRFCDGHGTCLYCTAPDAACTETDPGAAANTTQATAYDFGSIDDCDGSGSRFCGATKSGDADWFSYRWNGSDGGFLAFCVNDPRLQIAATASVHACIYASCVSGATPIGCSFTKSTAPNGVVGCCQDGANIDLNACSASQVWFSVEPSSGVAACVGYDFRFHP